MTTLKLFLQHIFLATLFCIPLQTMGMLELSLREAAEYNDEKEATRVIKAGANVNSRDIRNNTALLLAIKENYPNMGILLINNKANVNIPNCFSETPLHIAMEKLKAMEHLTTINYDDTYKYWANLIVLLLNNGAKVVTANHFTAETDQYRVIRCDRGLRIHESTSKERHKQLSRIHANLLRARIKEQQQDPQSISAFKQFVSTDYYENSVLPLSPNISKYFIDNTQTKNTTIIIKTFKS